MKRITSNSPTHEKLLALIKVQAAIQAIKLVEETGLATYHTIGVIDELLVYEKQLTEYITGEKQSG